MSKIMREQIDKINKFEEFINENSNPSEDEYKKALQDVTVLIPQISHRIIHQENLPHNDDVYRKINKEIKQKLVNGDDDVLDEMWELAWSGIMKNSINIITFYNKNNL